jgi:hypothetical protein
MAILESLWNTVPSDAQAAIVTVLDSLKKGYHYQPTRNVR